MTLDLPSPLNRVTIGICMDLNAQSSSWSLDEGPYELAQHVLDTKADTLLLLNAWLDSGANNEEDTDWQTLNYWAARLRPLWHADGSQSTSARKAVTVVVCNRSGVEEGEHDIRYSSSN
jgi:protein N-terminal amidase